jgi:nicotinamide mononucleotide adenylyltransferase
MREQASVHGRFQPFHNDHLEYVMAAKAQCEFLWIGITKYDISPMEASPLGAPREQPDHNPLSYFERVTMITEALVEAKIERSAFSFVPFPIETPNRLPFFMPTSITCFTTIREEWNRKKIQILEACGYEVVVLWERSEKAITGSFIRRGIAEGGDEWRKAVPIATARKVDELDLRSRLVELNKTAGLLRRS